MWPALEIAPRSILSVIKALKSAAGWFSQMYAALNKIRGDIYDATYRSHRTAIAPGRRVPGRCCGEPRTFFYSGLFRTFYSLFQEEKISCLHPLTPSCHPVRTDGALSLLCFALPGRWEPRSRPGLPAAAPMALPGLEAAGHLARSEEPEPLRAAGPSR